VTAKRTLFAAYLDGIDMSYASAARTLGERPDAFYRYLHGERDYPADLVHNIQILFPNLPGAVRMEIVNARAKPNWRKA
jgi:hypothetical protein